MTKMLSIEEVLGLLTTIRENQGNNPVNKYPQEIWDSIVQLTKKYSLKRISQELRISYRYLEKKIAKKNKTVSSVSFMEIPIKNILPDSVTIELNSGGLTAKIQGPISCLNSLYELFRRNP